MKRKKSITIRQTGSSDAEAIRNIQRLAFGQEEEATLTMNLINDPSAIPVVSLLAQSGHSPVGHILFTRARIQGSETIAHILAPLAVIPECHNQGIGSALIIEGLRLLKKEGSKLAFVLGHIEYYPRMGFLKDARSRGFPPPYPIPVEVKDAWMVQYLDPAYELEEPGGRVQCADALNRAEYWAE